MEKCVNEFNLGSLFYNKKNECKDDILKKKMLRLTINDNVWWKKIYESILFLFDFFVEKNP